MGLVEFLRNKVSQNKEKIADLTANDLSTRIESNEKVEKWNCSGTVRFQKLEQEMFKQKLVPGTTAMRKVKLLYESDTTCYHHLWS